MFSQIITYAMILFAVLGAIDHIIGYRMGGIGRKFDEAINAAGPLIMAIMGVFAGAPLLGPILTAGLGPFYRLFGADPAMAGAIFLSIDTGGYQLAHRMTRDADLANLSAIIQGAMLGPIIAWQMPLSLSIIPKQDQRWLAMGSLSGIIVTPVAVFIGGVFAGFNLNMVFHNVLPTAAVCSLLALGLLLIPEKMIQGAQVFCKIMTALIMAMLAIAIVQDFTPITIFKGMGTLAGGFEILSAVVPILAGAYPLMWFVSKALNKPLMIAARLLKINGISVAGMVATLANSLPMFEMVKDMDNRGKVMNYAWSSIAAFALGDHLAFCTVYEPDLLGAMIGCKIAGGVLAVLLSLAVFNLSAGRSEHTEAGNQGHNLISLHTPPPAPRQSLPENLL
jgi:ethanolamine transporter